jgi:hypothetical protein
MILVVNHYIACFWYGVSLRVHCLTAASFDLDCYINVTYVSLILLNREAFSRERFGFVLPREQLAPASECSRGCGVADVQSWKSFSASTAPSITTVEPDEPPEDFRTFANE